MRIMHDKAERNLIRHAKRSASIFVLPCIGTTQASDGIPRKVSNDYRLRDKIRIANNDSDVVEIARQSGFTFSTDEIWLYEDRTFKRKVGIRGWYTS